jgi:elongation factor G
MLAKGRLIGFPVVGVRVVINDGAVARGRLVDIAFQEAARGAFREFYGKREAGSSSRS